MMDIDMSDSVKQVMKYWSVPKTSCLEQTREQ